jgi:hypothetical protein
MSDDTGVLIIDNRASGNLIASNEAQWRCISDVVMGGLSSCELTPALIDGKSCLHLSGAVSLENNGGFVQASLDLAVPNLLDATAYRGIELEVCGNDQIYNVHLRTVDTNVVWQSYRASFLVTANWQTIQIPFDTFLPHRIDKKLNISQLRKLGIVAIGKEIPVSIYFRNLLMR